MKPTLKIQTLARRYLAHRRRLGYSLSGHDRVLLDFGAFCDHVAPGQAITTARVVEWAGQRDPSPSWRASRFGIVRQFALYCANLDPRTEVPLAGLLGKAPVRIRPHIYTPAEVALVMRRARRLTSVYLPLRPYTYETLIGLPACTGLRPTEALRLKRTDFDPVRGTIRVAPMKASPERELPLHPTAVAALQAYLEHRQRLCPMGEHLFVGPIGRPLARSNFRLIMRRLFRGIRSNGFRRIVRAYDFRHTFATRLIAKWSREEAPVEHRLLLLTRYMGHALFTHTLVVCFQSGRRPARRRQTVPALPQQSRHGGAMKQTFPELVQRFFGDFLPKQRHVSAHTIDSYRHTFRLLLPFLSDRTGKPIDRLDFGDFNADALLAFLAHLEAQRDNSIRTRNVRLAALRSFARYTTVFDAPGRLFSLQQVLAIPVKRSIKPVLGFLTREETTAILGAIKTTLWSGQRDHLFLSLLYNTGARVSELLQFRGEDLRGRVVRLHGKGRKEREVPIPASLAERLRRWCQSNQIRADRPVFTNLRGAPLSRDGVAFRLSTAVKTASRQCAPRSKSAESRRTPSATPRQCTCFNRASPWRLSRFGWATPPPSPPTDTCSPI